MEHIASITLVLISQQLFIMLICSLKAKPSSCNVFVCTFFFFSNRHLRVIFTIEVLIAETGDRVSDPFIFCIFIISFAFCCCVLKHHFSSFSKSSYFFLYIELVLTTSSFLSFSSIFLSFARFMFMSRTPRVLCAGETSAFCRGYFKKESSL